MSVGGNVFVIILVIIVLLVVVKKRKSPSGHSMQTVESNELNGYSGLSPRPPSDYARVGDQTTPGEADADNESHDPDDAIPADLRGSRHVYCNIND